METDEDYYNFANRVLTEVGPRLHAEDVDDVRKGSLTCGYPFDAVVQIIGLCHDGGVAFPAALSAEFRSLMLEPELIHDVQFAQCARDILERTTVAWSNSR